MTSSIIDTLLGDPQTDPGCDEVMSRLAVWAEQTHAGLDAAANLPALATHLQNCAACREDAEGLVAILRRDGSMDPKNRARVRRLSLHHRARDYR